jgi:hypothetical protein
MNGETPFTRDALLETFAAECALVAYGVALRTRTQGTWLDLELALWRAPADMATARELAGTGCPHRPARAPVCPRR